jgi:hypothetical protein
VVVEGSGSGKGELGGQKERYKYHRNPRDCFLIPLAANQQNNPRHLNICVHERYVRGSELAEGFEEGVRRLRQARGRRRLKMNVDEVGASGRA